jgi:DNA mismatch repair protein MutL
MFANDWGWVLSGKIVVLPEALAHRIAAGEVIERPASIVKELLENALDAAATDIRIELAKGGCGMIRISDNGEGIAPEDVPRAFERYATSKIYEFDDIYKVGTFGFRGEALPSIAAVARVELTTRPKGQPAGVKMIVTAGRAEQIADVGCPQGTSLTVTQIFDSVPVRKKFLKTESTEQGHCLDVITRTALAHPQVRIQVSANGRPILQIPATHDFSERVALILGMDVMDQLLPVQAGQEGMRLRGFVSRPHFSRSQSKHIFSFVNGRFIRDPLLNHAVMTAYRNVIEARKYPAAVLLLEVSPADVDVNVHPAKLEVRFRHAREIYSLIVETLAQTLALCAPAPATPEYAYGPVPHSPGDYRERVEEALKRYRVAGAGDKLSFPQALRLKEQGEWLPGVVRTGGELSGPLAMESSGALKFGDLEYMGQVARTYLVFSTPDRIVLMDQHAAHERVLFERLKENRAGQGISQRLLIPEVLHLSRKDLNLIGEYLNLLESSGIEAELFGEGTIAVKSVPAVCPDVNIRDVILDLLSSFQEGDSVPDHGDRQQKLFRILACKAAVKAGRSLSRIEVEALCRDLDQAPYAATCPHGRPVYITLDMTELEKRFKRK